MPVRSPYGDHLKPHLIPAVLIAVGVACEGAPYGTPERLQVPREAVLTSFGAFDDATGVETLSNPVAASVSESGRYLAVSDRSPPFLRVLDRRTDSVWTFGPEGAGPGELRAADAVEFRGDSVLLVLARDQFLERFTPRGGWQGGRSLHDAGLRVASITAGCGDRVYLHGLPLRYRHLDTLPLVHRLDLDADISTRPVLEVPGTDILFGWGGGLYGFDGTVSGVLYWDKTRDPGVGFWIPCSGSSPEIFSEGEKEGSDIETVLEAREGMGGQVMTLPDTLFHGAAARGSTKIWARYGRRPDTTSRVTKFRVVADERCREVELRGEWTLHDAHPDGLIVDRSHPFPTVHMLDWNWFEERLTRVRCPH